MFTEAIDLTFNVSHALQIFPPDYVRSVLGNPDFWSTETFPPTELQLAEVREWSKGLPALAHIMIPATPWAPRELRFPFSDMLFRPSVVFRYPAVANVHSPAPKQRWFFINGICTDHKRGNSQCPISTPGIQASADRDPQLHPRLSTPH
jgi:hypothetical protein